MANAERPDAETGGDLPDLTAAEFALGLLEGGERAAALRRLLADRDFAADVDAWRRRLEGLFAGVPAAEAPAGLEARVVAAVGTGDGRRLPRRAGPIAAIIGTIAASLLVAVAVGLMLRPAPAPPAAVPVLVAAPAPLIAAIAPIDRTAPLPVVYDRGAGELRLAGTMTVPDGRSAQLWAIVGKQAPQPLGLIRGDGATRIAIPPARRAALAGGTVLAISIEPVGGSPTGLPTGPVVATGTLAAT